MSSNKRKKRRLSPKLVRMWMAILLFLIAELFFYTWCRVQCVRTGYEISKENTEHRRLLMLQKNLKIEIARLKSPERIANIAKTQLGLVMPSARQTILIP